MWVTIAPIGFYSALTVVNNAVDCYQFFLAWSLITRIHRVDLELIRSKTIEKKLRREAVKNALVTKTYHDVFYPKESSCPVCLAEYNESDFVSSCCDQNKRRSPLIEKCPCDHMFHEECLTLWLQQHSNCPCCRFEILPLLSKRSLLEVSSITVQPTSVS